MLDGPRREYPKASGLVLVRSPLLISHVWRALVSSGRMSCCPYLVYHLFCLFCLFHFRIFCFFFAEDAVLRSIVLRSSICMRSDSHTQLPLSASVLFYVFPFFGDIAFSEYFCTITCTVFSLSWRVCVCIFFPFILDIKFVGHTSRGHTRYLPGRPLRSSSNPYTVYYIL